MVQEAAQDFSVWHGSPFAHTEGQQVISESPQFSKQVKVQVVSQPLVSHVLPSPWVHCKGQQSSISELQPALHLGITISSVQVS